MYSLFAQDQEGYLKADKDAYLKLADRLDAAGLDEISIEDAHRHNDLSLFQHFKNTKVFGRALNRRTATILLLLLSCRLF